jgi:hypothetical protein
MDVNLINAATGANAANAQGAQDAANADAALFQNLIAAALLQKGGAFAGTPRGGAAAQGTAPLSPAAARADGTAGTAIEAGADLGLLMRLLLGGGAFAATHDASAVSALPEALTRDTAGAPAEELLSAIALAPAETLLAASGTPAADAAAALLAADAAGTVCEDAADKVSAETRLAGTEAAKTPLPALTESLKPLLSGAAEDAAAARTEGAAAVNEPLTRATERAAVLLKASRVDALHALRADGETQSTGSAFADSAPGMTESAAANAGSSVPGGETPANGAARSAAAQADKIAQTGAPAENEAASAAQTGQQDGIATVSAGARTAESPAQSAESPAPYGQIAREVFAALANKNVPAVMSMRLEPAELGRIDVSMKLTSAGKLVIDIAAESAKTQALLAGQTDKLVQVLGLQNAQVENVSVTGAFQGQQAAPVYADRSMAFFMDLAGNGGREDRANRQPPRQGAVSAGIPAEEGLATESARYARRLDLTA